MLGESRDGNIKVVSVNPPYVFDQVDSMDEAIFNGFPLVLALRWVTSESQYIAAAMLLGFLERLKPS